MIYKDKMSPFETGQSITEFVIALPVLLLMLYTVVFFARLLIMKQRATMAARYISWYAGRHNDQEPSIDTVNALFFNKGTNISISHPSPAVGFAGNQLGELSGVLGTVAGIKGTGVSVKCDNYPLTHQRSSTGAQHFVFLDTWKENSSTGKALKYALWAIAVGKGFQGSNINIDLENPHIP